MGRSVDPLSSDVEDNSPSSCSSSLSLLFSAVARKEYDGATGERALCILGFDDDGFVVRVTREST